MNAAQSNKLITYRSTIYDFTHYFRVVMRPVAVIVMSFLCIEYKYEE